MSHRSYAVTIRPYHGVDDDIINSFVKYVEKYCEYYYVITEKEDSERHIHAGLFYKKSTLRSSIAVTLCRLFKNFTHEEKSVLQSGIKSMYNNDFMQNYMKKGDDTVVILENLPEVATLDKYFAEVPDRRKKGPASADPFYANLEKLWYKHKRPIEDCNPNNLRHFLMKMMNEERVIRVIADNRKIFQISCALSRYINKETSFNVEPEPFHQDV